MSKRKYVATIRAPKMLINNKMFDGNEYCSLGHLAKELGMDVGTYAETSIIPKIESRLSVSRDDVFRLMDGNDKACTSPTRVRRFIKWCSKNRVRVLKAKP